VEEGIRPDGRPLGKARGTSITPGVVTTADSSALVKLGHTTALAGVKLEVFIPTDAAPDQGRLVVAVEAPPLCHPDVRPGAPPELALLATEHVTQCLAAAGAVDLGDLCIEPRRAAWVAYLDIYLLDADGGTQDAALLAAVAALRGLRLPAVQVDATGNVVRDEGGAGGGRGLAVRDVPVSVTCGVFRGRVLVDLSAEEEEVAEAAATCCVDRAGRVVRFVKPGGAPLDLVTASAVAEVARARQREVAGML